MLTGIRVREKCKVIYKTIEQKLKLPTTTTILYLKKKREKGENIFENIYMNKDEHFTKRLPKLKTIFSFRFFVHFSNLKNMPKVSLYHKIRN